MNRTSNQPANSGLKLGRRSFLLRAGMFPAAVLGTLGGVQMALNALEKPRRNGGPRLKLSLNAYSFNQPLRDGTMSLDQLLEFCAEQQLDAVDITGYYFPGYPGVPSDETINHFKQRASILGLDISGTGVRNDFTQPDEDKRKDDVELVRRWIVAAAKLGAPTLRVFAGKLPASESDRPQALDWLVGHLKDCLPLAGQHGVMLALQNHNDFIQTSAQAIEVLEKVNSPWLGLMVDTGSFRQLDPYSEIERAAPFAVNWQVKELAYIKGETVPTDLPRLIRIVKASNYRGYIPLETLGEGDPKVKVPVMIQALRKALA